jgi:hypothetical protein
MKTAHVLAPALALALASFSLGPASAQEAVKPASSTATPSTTATQNSDAQALMKFSDEGHSAIQDVSEARVAIFDGNPKLAMDMISKATVSVDKAEAEAPSFAAKMKESVQGKVPDAEAAMEKGQMVPVDGQISLAEDYVPTPEKNAHIAKANEHLKNGQTQQALDELRLGQIDVMYNRVWMPLASTKTHLADATKLMDDHKYYEANLALKAVGDSLQTDSVDLVGTPVKGPLETTKTN